jgi:hypothetical protein
MNRNFYIDTVNKSPLYKEPSQFFWDLIQETTGEINHRFPQWPRSLPVEALNKIIVAYGILPPDQFNQRFTHYKGIALKFPTSPSTLWKTIAAGVLSPDLEAPYLKSISLPHPEQHQTNPSNNPAPKKITPRPTPTPQLHIQETPEETKPQLPLVKKPFSLKIAMLLCNDWRLDPRWEKLTPCAKLLFSWLIFRTYRKDTIRKIKQALANGETYFPWCLTGIDSLSKKLTYQPRSSTRMNHYENRQIRRALRQLWNLAFIHQIFRGYKDQGAGKYHVFLNPKMSARFNRPRVKTKQGATPKKRHSRMS